MNAPLVAAEMVTPDYDGGSIVNLMTSVGQAFRAPSRYLPLKLLGPDELAQPRNVVLLVIDGLGASYLERFENSFLRHHQRGRITTVFPSTTATAITTFVSGLAPAQHAIVGWFTFVKELGSVAAILPFKPRHGGPAYSRMGVDPRIVFDWEPFFDQLQARTYLVTRHDLVDSAYTVATGGSVKRCAYESLEGCFECLKHVLQQPGGDRQYVYAYWPAFDAIAHQFGINSAAARDHFLELDERIARFAEEVQGSDSLLIVCADHGLVDTSERNTIWLDRHCELGEALTLPLTGEPRAAYCYVRAAKRDAFTQYVQENLSHACFCIDSEEVVKTRGWFGPGTPHSALMHRIGDYTLVMRSVYTIKDRLPAEKPFHPVGVHGGMSADEMYVPLVVLHL